jgi:hypothetical protein
MHQRLVATHKNLQLLFSDFYKYYEELSLMTIGFFFNLLIHK